MTVYKPKKNNLLANQKIIVFQCAFEIDFQIEINIYENNNYLVFEYFYFFLILKQ